MPATAERVAAEPGLAKAMKMRMSSRPRARHARAIGGGEDVAGVDRVHARAEHRVVSALDHARVKHVET